MKYWLPGLCLMLLCSCEKPKDPGVDCALYDPFFSNLLIELVNDKGENLIENNTYVADAITISYKGTISRNVVFNEIPGLENLISLNLHGDAGDNTFILNLSDTVSDTLILNLSIDIPACNIPLFTLNRATYNGEVQMITNDNGSYKITVVK